MRVVYYNGQFVPETEAKISIFDSALMFGDMVFEMTRSFNKKHFKLKEHIDRLYTGLKILRIKIDISKENHLYMSNNFRATKECHVLSTIHYLLSKSRKPVSYLWSFILRMAKSGGIHSLADGKTKINCLSPKLKSHLGIVWKGLSCVWDGLKSIANKVETAIRWCLNKDQYLSKNNIKSISGNDNFEFIHHDKQCKL